MGKRKKGTTRFPLRRANWDRSQRKTPAGKTDLVTTFLEMTSPPTHAPAHPGQKIALLRADIPTLSFYRYLYQTIGTICFWNERVGLDDEELSAVIYADSVEIYVLYVGGVPAGFFELDYQQENQVEISHFGLIPEFLGRALEEFLLFCAMEKAWARQPGRIWVRTTNLDRCGLIRHYQRAGFTPYQQQTQLIDDPR